MKIFIIAEIGINHNGDISIAKKLIDVAVNAGCHAVKFQKRDIDLVYSKELLDSPRESQWGVTQRDQKMGLEFGKEEYSEIDAYCKKNIIKVLKQAKKMNINSVALLGNDGGKAKKLADLNIIVPHKNTARIQEAHIFLGHFILNCVEEKIFN